MQTKQRLDVPLSLKSVSDSGEFEGYGSVFGVKDSHDDVVMSGAFAASLRAWSDRKALPGYVPDMGEGYPDQCHHLAGNRADRGRHHPLHHHSLPPGDHR